MICINTYHVYMSNTNMPVENKFGAYQAFEDRERC